MSRGKLGGEASEVEGSDDGVGGPVNGGVVLGEPGFTYDQIKGIDLSQHKVQILTVVFNQERGRGNAFSSLHDRAISQTDTQGVLESGGGQLVLAHKAVREEIASGT